MALDLYNLRRGCSLSECIRGGGAVVYEDTGRPCIGSDTEGAAVSHRSTRGDGDFCRDRYFRSEEVPHQARVCPGSMGEF